jgi:exo-1,4-beta-D-glucosaminidase
VQGADSDSDCLFSWSGELLSRNFYWLLAKPDVPDFAKTEWYYTPLTEYADFLALQDLPKATVNASMTVSDAYQEAAAHVTIENTGSGLAFLVRLRLLKGKDGPEVLPVFFDDNYISLLPGEKREITVHVRKSDLGAAKPVLAVDGFNVAPVQLPYPRVPNFGVIFANRSVSANRRQDFTGPCHL